MLNPSRALLLASILATTRTSTLASTLASTLEPALASSFAQSVGQIPEQTPAQTLGQRAAVDSSRSGASSRVDDSHSATRAPAIGARIAPFTFTDTRWLPRSLEDFGPKSAYVIVFTTLDCPVAQRTLPRLVEIEKRWRAKDVQFLAIDVGESDTLVEVAARAVEQGLEFPVALDFDGEAVRAIHPDRTPEVVVLDRDRSLKYRGRVDASERLGGPTAAPARDDLEQALVDVLAGRDVAIATTNVDGCKITARSERAQPAHVPTFAEDVAPIFLDRCVACHVAGGSAPFELATFPSARSHAAMIAEVVEQGRMPPWHASEKYGMFENVRKLSLNERTLILAWAENGAPSGDLAQAPVAPTPSVSASGWRIGEPDLVVSMLSSIALPAHGVVPYKYVVLPHVFTSDTWVEAVEIRPTNKKALHHANLGFYQFGGDVKAANFITGEVPGGDPMDLGAGTAVKIPAGSVLGLQIHYVPTGTATEDRISVGLRFPRQTVQRQLRHHEIANQRFAIPAFAPAFPVQAERTFDVDAIGIGMYVHMHLRGRDMRFDAHYPSGANETLLFVPNYSFDWQMAYRWNKGAQLFPKGTSVACLAHFDNSRFNPWNPDPSKVVTFGQETTDEMMYGFLFYVARDEALNLKIDPQTGQVVAH